MNESQPGTVVLSEEMRASGVSRVWIEATVTRADGTVETLGVVSDSNQPAKD